MCDRLNEALVRTFRNDDLVFATTMLGGLRTLFSECHAIKDYAFAKLELPENHTDFVRSIGKLDSNVRELLQNAKRFDTRLERQARRVAEKLASTVAKPCLKKPKSKNRQDAGKRKAGSLQSWHAEFMAARKALKDTGYTGSLLLKKGMPMYATIQELRQASYATM